MHYPTMAAIGRFQKGEIFHAKVVDGELFRLRGDILARRRSTKPMPGRACVSPINPSKIIAVGLNYADHARETGKALPRSPLFLDQSHTSLLPDGGKIEIPFPRHRTDYKRNPSSLAGASATSPPNRRCILGYTAAQDISDRNIKPGRNGAAASRSTPSLHWGPTSKPNSIRMTSASSSFKTGNSARIPTRASSSSTATSSSASSP